MNTKLCDKCGELKSVEDFPVRKDTGKPRGPCKKCNCTRAKKYYEENRDKCIESNRMYWDRTREERNSKQKEYRDAHREELRARGRAFRQRHLSRMRDKGRAYYQSNKERVKAQKRAWYQRNKAELLGRNREKHAENPEIRRKKMRLAYARNPRPHIERVRARRARVRGAQGFATPVQIAGRVAFWGHKCWMCGGPFECIDHVKPLARGGTNWPANLRPACTACNTAKRDAWPLSEITERVKRVHIVRL